ncbi:MAG: hypothetical protein ACM33T_17350 [Solirubrobacterales bacterium]
MLGKMIIHGLIAATLIGSAAAVYAQAARDTGYLSPTGPSAPTQTSANPDKDNGYLRPAMRSEREHDRERGWSRSEHSERRHDGREHERRKHSRDRDDD